MLDTFKWQKISIKIFNIACYIYIFILEYLLFIFICSVIQVQRFARKFMKPLITFIQFSKVLRNSDKVYVMLIYLYD